MTDNERMLRLTADQYYRIAVRFRRENGGVAVLMPEELSRPFDELEPAPPKGWKPICYVKVERQEVEHQDVICGVGFLNPDARCQQCTWRKKEND